MCYRCHCKTPVALRDWYLITELFSELFDPVAASVVLDLRVVIALSSISLPRNQPEGRPFRRKDRRRVCG